MYPVLFRIGDFEISSFGVLMAFGALAGLWLFRRELAARRLPESAVDAAVFGLIGGIAGAKLFYVFENLAPGRFFELLLDRAGLTWYGGLLGGIGAAVLVLVYRSLPVLPVLAAATPGLALGHFFGRIGCFLVGDDYGRPTALPWGVAFPEGLPPTVEPVHPTQLYEAAFLACLTIVLLRWRRRGVADRIVLGRYLALAAAARFTIEFIRINPVVALGLTVAQWVAVALVLAGLMLWFGARSASEGASRQSRRRSPRARGIGVQ